MPNITTLTDLCHFRYIEYSLRPKPPIWEILDFTFEHQPINLLLYYICYPFALPLFISFVNHYLSGIHYMSKFCNFYISTNFTLQLKEGLYFYENSPRELRHILFVDISIRPRWLYFYFLSDKLSYNLGRPAGLNFLF